MSLLTACDKGRLSPVAYIHYLEDKGNGFKKSSVAGQWQYKVQYKPAGYIYLQERKGAGLSQADYNQRKAQLADWCFFNVYVQHDTIHTAAPIRLISNNLARYNTALSYYLSTNSSNFILYTGKDTLYPVIYNYENNYNLSPEDVFVVGFHLKKSDLKSARQMMLVYDDELLQTGFVRFAFDLKKIQNEPQIDFNE
ncbi:MAG: hypothetical protein JSU01_03805 [Bacteroidetes bacterium]|nr:hypothetical protein [Bacteroidota bacterium]